MKSLPAFRAICVIHLSRRSSSFLCYLCKPMLSDLYQKSSGMYLGGMFTSSTPNFNAGINPKMQAYIKTTKFSGKPFQNTKNVIHFIPAKIVNDAALVNKLVLSLCLRTYSAYGLRNLGFAISTYMYVCLKSHNFNWQPKSQCSESAEKDYPLAPPIELNRGVDAQLLQHPPTMLSQMLTVGAHRKLADHYLWVPQFIKKIFW